MWEWVFRVKDKIEFAFPLTVCLSTCHILGLILMVAAINMESVPVFAPKSLEWLYGAAKSNFRKLHSDSDWHVQLWMYDKLILPLNVSITKVEKFLDGKSIKKCVVVPGRIVNFVVSELLFLMIMSWVTENTNQSFETRGNGWFVNLLFSIVITITSYRSIMVKA